MKKLSIKYIVYIWDYSNEANTDIWIKEVMLDTNFEAIKHISSHPRVNETFFKIEEVVGNEQGFKNW